MARLTLRHDRLDMARLAAWLDQQEQAMAIPDKMALAARQCLEEAVANLITHTPPQAPLPAGVDAGDAIAVTLDWSGHDLVAAVEDRGPPFDLRAAPPIEHATTLEAIEPGGWGIQLIRAFATDIDYRSSAGCNRLTLRFAGRNDRTVC